MEPLKRAKIALRKHIKEKPEKVKKDLEEMRKRSSGKATLDYYVEIVMAINEIKNKTK